MSQSRNMSQKNESWYFAYHDFHDHHGKFAGCFSTDAEGDSIE